MISLGNSQDDAVSATIATKILARAIMVSSGEFSLILACCNSVKKQQQILNLLRELSSANIQEVLLAPTDETLYTTIVNTIGDAKPEALIVHGLEAVVGINQLLISTNLMRDELRKKFHFPLVLWVNDEILGKLVWLAPDLKNWAACTIRFDVANNLVIDKSALSA
jgi:hypothetical protein